MRLTFVVGVAAALLSLVVAGCSKSVGDAPSPRGKIPIRTAAPRSAPSSAPNSAPNSAPAAPVASVESVEAQAAVTKPVEAKPAPAATAVVTPVANDKPLAETKPAAPKAGAKPVVDAKVAADAQPKADAKPAAARAKAGDSRPPSVWRLGLQKGAEATLDELASGGFVVATSNLPELSRWNVQVIGPPIEIEADRAYRIKFRARAATPRQVTSRLCEAQSPWGSVGFEQDLDLTGDWQDFSFDFESGKSVEKATLRFYLGNDAARVEFEDISVEPRP